MSAIIIGCDSRAIKSLLRVIRLIEKVSDLNAGRQRRGEWDSDWRWPSILTACYNSLHSVQDCVGWRWEEDGHYRNAIIGGHSNCLLRFLRGTRHKRERMLMDKIIKSPPNRFISQGSGFILRASLWLCSNIEFHAKPDWRRRRRNRRRLGRV